MAHDILVLMGATGTGKSALALEIAQRRPAVIINADAMQLVHELRIITARPSDADMAQAEHALYGVLPAHEPTSVARWLALVAPVVREAWAQGKLPMLVGGTGMYIQAMMRGLASVPAIPEAVHAEIRAMPHPQRLQALQQRDPVMAEQLKPGDTQRIQRALEVVTATGISLKQWQQQHATPLFQEARYHYAHVQMPRAQLYTRLDARFADMMAAGALDEVKALKALDLSAHMPILRAHGVPELMAYLAGNSSLEESVAKAQQHTRNYAKRQLTWLRNQMPGSLGVAPGEADSVLSLL